MAPVRKARKKQCEAGAQRAYFEWLAKQHPAIYAVTFAIPNGGARDIRTGYALKLQGVKRGVPDIFIPVPRGTFHGFFLEFKHGANKLTAEQKIMIENLSKEGYVCSVAYTVYDAIELTNQYLGMSKC